MAAAASPRRRRDPVGRARCHKTTFFVALPCARVTSPVTSPTFRSVTVITERSRVHLTCIACGQSAAEWGDLEPFFEDHVLVSGPILERRTSPATASGLLEHEEVTPPSRAHLCRERLSTKHLLMLVPPSTPRHVARALSSWTARCRRAWRSRATLSVRRRAARRVGATPRIRRLVVGTRPGSFTSTRIASAFARGLVLALDPPGECVDVAASRPLLRRLP